MARVYRSRARRRTRRLVVLLAVAGVLAVADVAAGSPALGVLAETRAAVTGPASSAGSYATGAPAPGRPAPAPHQAPHGPATTAIPPAPTATPPETIPTPPAATPPAAPAPVPGGPDGPSTVPIDAVGPGEVALTIDDGPDPRWTPQVLDLLAARGIHATFCLVGTQARAYPDLVRRIAAEGHTLCDHTESHDIHLPAASRATVRREVRGGYDAIVAATGRAPALFRAPGGNWSPTIIAAAGQLGMRPLDWNVDTRDWTRPGTAAIAASLRAAPSGAVILVHDGGGDRSQTVAALRTALPMLQSRGLTFVTP